MITLCFRSVVCRCFLLILLVTAGVSCNTCKCTFGTPDETAFSKVVLSPALRDSLKLHKITVGMPYSVVRSVFAGCGSDTAIPVASAGSRQMLDEREGLFSHFHDPNIQVYLDKYCTSQGTLYIWYLNPDFYRSDISKGDSVFLYSDSKVDTAKVVSLSKSKVLAISKPLTANLAVPYAEIHSREQIGKTSYWYGMTMIDQTTLKQQPQSTPSYPIVHLELDKTVITSFSWK